MENECIICFEELTYNIVTLSCNHKYHKKCINNWSETKNENINFPKCPICNDFMEIINIENVTNINNNNKLFRKIKNYKCCIIL